MIMFSRKSEENKISDQQLQDTTIQEKILSENLDFQKQELQNIPEENEPEIVHVVEKISSIVSPYFIAIIGLYLYDRNILIGFLLIAIGIISLLKITLQDIDELVDKVKSFFSLEK